MFVAAPLPSSPGATHAVTVPAWRTTVSSLDACGAKAAPAGARGRTVFRLLATAECVFGGYRGDGCLRSWRGYILCAEGWSQGVVCVYSNGRERQGRVQSLCVSPLGNC